MKKSRKDSNNVTSISRGFHIEPKTQLQDNFLRSLRDPTLQLVIGVGPAGTGKTYCAASSAASQFLAGRYKRIIVTRPNVSTGRSLGFFPGTPEEKLAIWLAPVLNVLKLHLSNGRYQYNLGKGNILMQPLEVIRGASFEDSIILVDESQNLTREEIKALSTRVGEGSKLVFLGDPNQKDLKDSGLVWFLDLCERYQVNHGSTHFTSEDIVRSGLTKQLVQAFEQES